ncbi:MAG: rhodanese-like domain-containing protein [Pseudomonadota bacterium]
MTQRPLLTLVATFFTLGSVQATLAEENSPANQALASYHHVLLERYPDVEHISTGALVGLSEKSVVLFDVRNQAEFKISHLASATRVSPSISPQSFLKSFGGELEGKTVVFYCSVGERSSKLAQALLDMDDPIPFDVVNLEGGIFQWHNENRPVIDAGGTTQSIHPFNRSWGRLLERREHIQER